MNYKKLWNDLKDEMIKKTEQTEKDFETKFLRSSEILMMMSKAEVAESRKTEEGSIDLVLANLLGGNKNGSN